jgi:molybdopterin converting factor small subunit
VTAIPLPIATDVGSAGGPAPAPVTFRMFAAARAASGSSEVDVAPGPTREVVASLAAGLPPRFADVLSVSSLVADGHRLDPSSPALIHGGTVIDVLPPFAGG